MNASTRLEPGLGGVFLGLASTCTFLLMSSELQHLPEVGALYFVSIIHTFRFIGKDEKKLKNGCGGLCGV